MTTSKEPFAGSFLLGTARQLDTLEPPPQPHLTRQARNAFEKLAEDLAALAKGKAQHTR